MSMTLAEARKKLPSFACGLGICAKSVAAIRRAVAEEISAYDRGENPLEPRQIKALKKFLVKTQ